MSQVDKLLDSLTDEELAAYGTTSEGEPHIVIGSNRRIIIPEQLKRIAVQYDHDVETVIFDCPRYWDNHDMSTMAIYINYMRSDGYADSYPADNVTVDGDIMHFSWTISRNVTEVQGNISFLVCVKNTDAEGNEINHWNSELSTGMYVSEGMETEEQVLEFYPDLVTQLLLRMDSVEKINIQASEMNSLLASAEEAKDAAENARDIVLDESDYIKNSYANAIKGSKKGEIIQVDDVSPIEHNLGVKVSSKNLFDIDKVLNTDNWYYNGGSISYPLNLTKGVRYTFSIENLQTFTDNFAIVRKANVSLWAYTELFAINGKVGKLTYSFVADGTECLWMYAEGIGSAAAFQNRINNILLNYTKSLQLELGDTATEYTPYVEPSTVPIKRYGKNLFDINSSWKWELGDSYSHMDIFVGANQTVTVSWDNDLTLGQGLYINIANELKHKGNSTSPYWLYHSTVSDLCKRSVTVTADADGYIYINFVGDTDKVAKLQVEYGTTATDFEPYIEPQTAVANAEGIVTGLTSVSPNMTVIADNNGVNLNVTYNVDTKTYIDDKSTPAKFTKVYESGEIRPSVDEYGDYTSAFHSVENLNLTKCLVVVESTNEDNGYTLDTSISIDVNNRSFYPYFEPKSYGKLIIDCDVEDGILRAKHWTNDDIMYEHTSVVDMSAQGGVMFADKINKIAIELWSNFKFTIYGR